MTTQQKREVNVRYDIRTSDFVISSNESGIPFSAPWIIRDGSGMQTDKTDLIKYFHELCGIFGEQIKEFGSLKRQATKAEQKRLQTLLALTLEAQALLYEDEDS
ncbi:MAG: hypothetical protein HY007_03980 [Candidatus Sungbacteria bacterium]|nr:hypothetical protein [Candidatus Sungbacteria bacterium]